MEVATFVKNVTQFEPNESTGMCVAFSAAQIIRMVAPGHANASSPEDIDQFADYIYVTITGQMTKPIGITVDQLKVILWSYGISFEEIGTNTNSIDAAITSGCPVIVMGAESDFHYLTGDSPYSWNTAGINHCIIIDGLSNNGGYEVRDSANSSDGPVVYNKKMGLFSAIKVFPTWIGGNVIPLGWTDDGSTLTAPNGHKVVLGFRDYVLANKWNTNNVPLEEEYHADPVEEYNNQSGANSGSRQMFLSCELIWTPQRGVYLAGIGRELLGTRNERDQLRKQVTTSHS